VKVLGTGFLSLLEDTQNIWSFTASFIFFWFCCVSFIYGCVFCMLLFDIYIMYSYCYVCSVLGIVFHCVVPCIVCV